MLVMGEEEFLNCINLIVPFNLNVKWEIFLSGLRIYSLSRKGIQGGTENSTKIRHLSFSPYASCTD